MSVAASSREKFSMLGRDNERQTFRKQWFVHKYRRNFIVDIMN
jgi:hypothetical protein